MKARLITIREMKMDGSTAGAVSSISQSFEGITTLLSSMAYLLGIGFGIQTALSMKKTSEGAEGGSMGKTMSLAAVTAAVLALPTFMAATKDQIAGPVEQVEQVEQVGKMVEIQEASRKIQEASRKAEAVADKGDPEKAIAQADKSPDQAPLAKAAEAPAGNPLTKVANETPAASIAQPIVIEKLATPEEARASADRKAFLEVFFGVGIALAAGAVAWIAARRRRGSAPAEALPEVKFLDGGGKAAFAESDIFAKTAAFDKAKAPGEQP